MIINKEAASAPHYLLIVNDMELDNEKLLMLQTAFYRQDIQKVTRVWEQTCANQTQIANNYHNALDKQHQWSTASECLQYLTFAGMTVVALSGGGSVLVITASALSAIIGVGNLVATKGGYWESLFGRDIAHKIDTACTYTALALSAIGSFGFTGLNSYAQLFQVATNTMQVGTNLANGSCTKTIQYYQADMTKNNYQESSLKQTMKAKSSDIQSTFRTHQSLQEMVREANTRNQ
jgi:hypothetical protein